jgi:NDP-sugar pyrophosphorylase family protein
MQVVILAGGLGTRLGTLAERLPKALMPVLGRPFLAHVLELLASQGFGRFLLLVGHHGDMIEAALGNGDGLGLSISYANDGPELLGTGGAVRRALPLLEREFLLMYGDTYLDIDYRSVTAAFQAQPEPALMTVYRNGGRFDRSNAVFRGGRLERYSKRETTPDMEHIDYGLAALRRELVEEQPMRGRFDLAELYSALVASGRMTGHEVFQRFYEIGTPESLAECEAYIRNRSASPEPHGSAPRSAPPRS